MSLYGASRQSNDKASNTPSKVLGVVLAGGRSSRMGQDKALMQIAGQNMIDRTRSLLKSTGLTKVVISRNDKGENHYDDLICGKGPLSGIHSIANHFPDFDLMIVPVDLPLLSKEAIQALINLGQIQSKNARYSQQNLPLYLQNNTTTRQVLDNILINTKRFSVAHFCSHFPIAELTDRLASDMVNANTPSDWQFALKQFNKGLTSGGKETHYESFN